MRIQSELLRRQLRRRSRGSLIVRVVERFLNESIASFGNLSHFIHRRFRSRIHQIRRRWLRSHGRGVVHQRRTHPPFSFTVILRVSIVRYMNYSLARRRMHSKIEEETFCCVTLQGGSCKVRVIRYFGVDQSGFDFYIFFLKKKKERAFFSNARALNVFKKSTTYGPISVHTRLPQKDGKSNPRQPV